MNGLIEPQIISWLGLGCPAQFCRMNILALSGGLDMGGARRAMVSEHNREPGHSFVANQSDLTLHALYPRRLCARSKLSMRTTFKGNSPSECEPTRISRLRLQLARPSRMSSAPIAISCALT